MYKCPRRFDFFLMDVVLRSDLSKEHQEIFNRVRLNLRLLTASDIVCTDKRTRIHPDILRGRNARGSELNWPNMMDIPKSWYEIFQNVLKNVISPQLQSTPLGPWIDEGHQSFENYVDTASNQTIGSDEYKGLDPNTKCRYNAIDVENTSGKILGYRILKNHMRHDDDTHSPNLDIKAKPPKWLRNLWRGTQFNQKTHDTTIAELEKDNVCMAGDGSVRDQLGAHAWCLAQKERDEPFFKTSSPVDGSRHTMRALRAESSHVLAGIAYICSLEQYVSNTNVTIPIYTDCQTLVNRMKATHINNPTLVIADHMDIIYQIRTLMKESKFKFDVVYTRSIKNDEFNEGTAAEKLVQRMHLVAYNYFTTPHAILPRKFTDFFPGSEISVVANEKPIISDIGMSLQSMEKQLAREEYLRRRFELHEGSIQNIDSYTLGRVIMKTSHRHQIYTKIIHKELNTMVVNERWGMGSNICPVCTKEVEDWFHVLVCRNPDMIRIRDGVICDLSIDFERLKTYPPLAKYIITYLENLHQKRSPDQPPTVDQKYHSKFQQAYVNQCSIGWDNFLRGIISMQWRFLQHNYFLEIKNRDMYAVDKWARMLIKSLLEMNRRMWMERCAILHAENNATYERRRRDEIWNLCLYLRRTNHLIPHPDWHLLHKPYSFFNMSPMNNVILWEQGIMIKLRRFRLRGNGDIRKFMIRTTDNDENMKHENCKRKRENTEEKKRKQLKLTDLFGHNNNNHDLSHSKHQNEVERKMFENDIKDVTMEIRMCVRENIDVHMKSVNRRKRRRKQQKRTNTKRRQTRRNVHIGTSGHVNDDPYLFK